MYNIQASYRIAMYHLRKKTTIVLLFAYALFALFYISRYSVINAICTDYQVKVSFLGIYAYSHNDHWTMLIMMIGWFYLVGDAPFADETQQYIFIRCSKISWMMGIVMFIHIFAALYLIWMFLICFVLFIMNGSTSCNWDSVLRSLTSVRTLIKMYEPMFSFSPYIINNYTVAEAFLFTALLRYMMLILYGLIVTVANYFLHNNIGAFVSGGILVMDMVASKMVVSDSYYSFSTVSLSNLNILDLHGSSNRPTLTYAICFYITALVGVCSILVITTCGRKEIRRLFAQRRCRNDHDCL